MPWRGVWPGAALRRPDHRDRQRGLPLLPRRSRTIDQLGGALGFILIALIWFYADRLGAAGRRGDQRPALRAARHRDACEEERARAVRRSSSGTRSRSDRSSSAARIASSIGVGSTSNRAIPDGSVTIVSVDRPSTSGRATPTSTGVTSPIQSDDRYGVSSGTRSAAAAGGRALAPSRRSSRRRWSPRARRSRSRGRRTPATSGAAAQVGDHVGDRDRLRAGRDPARGDHHRQALDQVAGRSETTRCPTPITAAARK